MAKAKKRRKRIDHYLVAYRAEEKKRLKKEAQEEARAQRDAKKIKKTPPDYNCDEMVKGDLYYELELSKKVYGYPPHYTDDKTKKLKVTVSLAREHGDIHHVYAKITVEPNWFWCPPCKDYPKGAWCNSHRWGRTASFEERWNTFDGAAAYARLIIKEHFKGPQYEVVITRNFSKEVPFSYRREGD